MFANIHNYHNYHNSKFKIKILTNCKCAFSSSQVCTCMQNYQITKLKKSPKLEIGSAFLGFTSLHMLNLHVFILACTIKL
jgi:hypothetical protein